MSMDEPNPRRLLWSKDYLEVFRMPSDSQNAGPGLQYYWHGISCFQYGMFALASERFCQAIELGFDHEYVRLLLGQANDRAVGKTVAQSHGASSEGVAGEFVRYDEAGRIMNYRGSPV